MTTAKHRNRLRAPPPATTDGALFADFKIEGGELVRRTRQPSEDRILDRNRELRKNPGALRSLESMGLELTIPELHYHRLLQKHPALGSPNAEVKTRAWRWFMSTSEADPYRVRDRNKGRKNV